MEIDLVREKIFVICPVRNITPDIKLSLENFVLNLVKDYDVHYPAWDTDQDNDPAGMRICNDNKRAIQLADGIVIAWDGKSHGSLFDFGMVFCLQKRVALIPVPGLYPVKTEGKSFSNMLLAYADTFPFKLKHSS